MISNIEQEFNIKKFIGGRIPEEFYEAQFAKLRILAKEFPWVYNVIHCIKENGFMKNTYMNVRPLYSMETKQVEIRVSVQNCKYLDELEDGYDYGVESGYHPRNSTCDDILLHEIGHAMSYLIVPNIEHNRREWLRLQDDVIKESINTLEKVYGLKHKSKANWRRTVCRYAGTNNSECIAESFVDYIVNGKNCCDLAKEIIKNIKYRLHRNYPL